MKRYSVDENTILVITNEVIEKINIYRQTKRKYEAGGILLGKVRADYSEYIIEDISEPSLKDKRFRFGFIRNKNNAQRVINEAFKKSNGITHYLGEWHTHPESNPEPSSVDRELIDKSINETENVLDRIFMIILGFDGSLYIGSKIKGNGKMIEISEIEEK